MLQALVRAVPWQALGLHHLVEVCAQRERNIYPHFPIVQNVFRIMLGLKTWDQPKCECFRKLCGWKST